MLKAISLHIGVFALLLGGAVGLTRFLGFSTDLIRAVPVLYLLYLGVAITVSVLKKKKNDREKNL